MSEKRDRIEYGSLEAAEMEHRAKRAKLDGSDSGHAMSASVAAGIKAGNINIASSGSPAMN